MAERTRRKRQPAQHSSASAQPRAAQPPHGEAAATSVEKQGLNENMDDTRTSEEPQTAHTNDTIVVDNNDEGRNTMAQTGETTRESMIGNTGAAIKDGIVGSLKGVNEIETQLVSVVGHTVSDTLQTTGTVAKDGLLVAKDVISGTVQAVTDVGTGLTNGVKNVAKGVVTGVNEVGGDVFNLAQQTAEGVISGVADLGAMVGDVANRTARGTVETTKEVGGNVGSLARSTVEGTIDAVDSIGGAAVKTVSHLLVSVVEGVKDVLNAALPKPNAPRE